MVSGINNNSMSSVNKIGETPNGRIVYEISSPEGKTAGMLSVAKQDCDTFERAYSDIIESAPKVEAYMNSQTPESMKRMQKNAKRTILISTGIGAIIPAAIRKLKMWVAIPLSLAGGVVGFFAGKAIAKSLYAPPGIDKLTNATQTLSKIDIQPVEL